VTVSVGLVGGPSVHPQPLGRRASQSPARPLTSTIRFRSRRHTMRVQIHRSLTPLNMSFGCSTAAVSGVATAAVSGVATAAASSLSQRRRGAG